MVAKIIVFFFLSLALDVGGAGVCTVGLDFLGGERAIPGGGGNGANISFGSSKSVFLGVEGGGDGGEVAGVGARLGDGELAGVVPLLDDNGELAGVGEGLGAFSLFGESASKFLPWPLSTPKVDPECSVDKYLELPFSEKGLLLVLLPSKVFLFILSGRELVSLFILLFILFMSPLPSRGCKSIFLSINCFLQGLPSFSTCINQIR